MVAACRAARRLGGMSCGRRMDRRSCRTFDLGRSPLRSLRLRPLPERALWERTLSRCLPSRTPSLSLSPLAGEGFARKRRRWNAPALFLPPPAGEGGRRPEGGDVAAEERPLPPAGTFPRCAGEGFDRKRRRWNERTLFLPRPRGKGFDRRRRRWKAPTLFLPPAQREGFDRQPTTRARQAIGSSGAANQPLATGSPAASFVR